MTDTPPTMTPATAPASSGGIMSPITPDPVGTPDLGVMGYVKKCFSPYVNFSGRARRKEYGLFCLFYLVVIIVLGILASVAGAATGNADGPGVGGLIFSLLMWLFVLACLIPYFGVTIRRTHDMGLPFWVGIIALFFNWVGILILLFVPSQDGANIYGPYPKPRV